MYICIYVATVLCGPTPSECWSAAVAPLRPCNKARRDLARELPDGRCMPNAAMFVHVSQMLPSVQQVRAASACSKWFVVRSCSDRAAA